MKGLDPMPDTDNGSFDDLLGELPSEEEKNAIQGLKVDGGETPEQARLRELESQLAALRKEKAEPVEKTSAEKDEEHRRALEANRRVDSAVTDYEDPSEDGEILEIHFLDDGITSNGRVWEKGQTVQYVVGGAAYNDTKDRNGYTWLEHLSHSEQLARWGRIRVGLGPYPLPLPEDHINPEEKKRGKRAPVLR
jgi:hypothetical protein